MARPTLASHPKFAKLAHRLKSRALARGVLELIWEACYASGDPVIGDGTAVEALADWRGKPGVLVAILAADCRFLDEVRAPIEGGRVETIYAVHDLEDHAPDYVQKRMAREAQRRLNGQSLRSIRQAAARASHRARAANDLQSGANESQLQADAIRLSANDQPPAPAPAPAPKERETSRAIPDPWYGALGPRPGGTPMHSNTTAFQRVFAAYKNKSGQWPAQAEFAHLAEHHPAGADGLADDVLGALERLATSKPFNGDAGYWPKLETFLKERRWIDAPTPAATSSGRGATASGGYAPAANGRDYTQGVELFRKEG